jgi:hypothetical protein
MPSLELVDRHDQSARGRYMEYQSANEDGTTATTNGHGQSSSRSNGGSPSKGNGTDLIFTVEEGRNGCGRNGHPGGVPPVADPSDEYFGLEQELEFRLARRRRNRYIALGALLVAFIAGIMVHRAARDVEEGVEEVEDDLRGKGYHLGVKGHSSSSNNNNKNKNKPSSPTYKPASSPSSAGSAVEEAVEDVAEQIEEIEAVATASLWPTATPPSSFDICPPRLYPDIQSQKDDKLPVFHIGEFATVPESASKNGNDDPLDATDEEWEYALSAMDLSDDASIIAVGFSDYSGPPAADGGLQASYSAVGMVRTFAYDCHRNAYHQIGQDLRGSNEGEQFGHHISTSSDGKTMAISAPSESYDGGNGFVNVYYLDESQIQPRWSKLGSRIDNLDTSVGYSRVGHAISLSSRGETLAILGIIDVNSYIIRVYEYDSFSKTWKLKGKQLPVTVSYGDSDSTYEFAPQISLSDKGDELSVSDPEFGIVRYKYKWQTAKWTQMESKGVNFTYAELDDVDSDSEWWIDGVATDRSADVVAFTAWENNYDTDSYDFQAIKLVDFTTGQPVEGYDSLWKDYSVGVNVAVAQDGGVAAIVVSKYDVDDDEFWSDESIIGALTILNKGGDASWSVLGKGTESEGMGVPGDFVSLSGDGRIVAVGSADVVALYGVLPGGEGGAGDHATTEDTTEDNAASDVDSEPDFTTAKFDVCAPFPDTDPGTSPGVLDSLPKSPDEHTIAIALSSDASFLAIGLDSYDGEDRGLAKVYGWSCSDAKYLPVGQDLFGEEEFDGFGQAVDLSSDGKTLVVGANQPPPGKSGYVKVYALAEDGGDDGASFEWKLVGQRIADLPDNVGDVGREVKISHDGNVVTFLGSIVSEAADGFDYDHSFVRTVHNKNGEWKPLGDDLVASVDFDEYGSETLISMAGDGSTIAVVGSYGDWMSKIYTYNTDKKNWTEVVIPSPGTSYDDLDDWEYDDDGGYGYVEWDDDIYYSYFTGKDVSLNYDGKILAVAGTGYTDTEEGAMVRMLRLNSSGNWTLSSDPIDFSDDYVLSAVDIDDDGGQMAVGINSHTDGFDDQGALFLVSAITDVDGDGFLDWSNTTGIVEGQNMDDLLGSRVVVSSDGTIAAASSRKGYVSFYKMDNE